MVALIHPQVTQSMITINQPTPVPIQVTIILRQAKDDPSHRPQLYCPGIADPAVDIIQ
jgi:hypothetical protein